MNYKRLNKIDDELKDLVDFKKDLLGGSYCKPVLGINIKRVVKIEIEGGLSDLYYQRGCMSFDIVVDDIERQLNDKIDELEEEKVRIQDVKWWQFWK